MSYSYEKVTALTGVTSINGAAYIPYVPSTDGSKGTAGQLNLADGAHGWENTNWNFPSGFPTNPNQVLSNTTTANPTPFVFQDQKICICNNATLLTDSTNPVSATLYLLSNFSATPISPTATAVPICTFQLVDGKSYTLSITAASTAVPLVSGSLTVGCCTNTYLGMTGSGAINFTPTAIAASNITITSADFNQPTGFYATATWTQSGGSNLATVYFNIPAASTWTVDSNINFGVEVTQNN